MKKVLWVDVIKGIGIISVVAGHIYDGEILRIIYLFHMPLFFFLSGYLFKPTSEYKNYLLKKSIHLLIPYFSFLVLFDLKAIAGFAVNLLNNSMSNEKWEFYKEHFSNLIHGGAELKGAFTVFWFVTCLFLTQQLMNFLISKFNVYKLAPLIIVLLILSYYNSSIFNSNLIWNVNIIFASAPIFYIGYLFKTLNLQLNKFFLVLLGILVALISFLFPENIYDMKVAEYGIPFITLLSSLIIILNIKNFSIFLSNYKLLNKVFSELGRGSMIIMYLHSLIQILVLNHFTANHTIRFITSTVISYIIYLILAKFKFSKAIFLGSFKDLKDLPNSVRTLLPKF